MTGEKPAIGMSRLGGGGGTGTPCPSPGSPPPTPCKETPGGPHNIMQFNVATSQQDLFPLFLPACGQNTTFQVCLCVVFASPEKRSLETEPFRIIYHTAPKTMSMAGRLIITQRNGLCPHKRVFYCTCQ